MDGSKDNAYREGRKGLCIGLYECKVGALTGKSEVGVVSLLGIDL